MPLILSIEDTTRDTISGLYLHIFNFFLYLITEPIPLLFDHYPASIKYVGLFYVYFSETLNWLSYLAFCKSFPNQFIFILKCKYTYGQKKCN